MLSGHRRYTHITGIRIDDVLLQLLGFGKLRGKDTARRALEKQNKEAFTLWMDRQMDETCAAQPSLPGLTLEHKGGRWYEHAVLVTNWAQRELLVVAQMYRDRARAENLFHQLKKQCARRGSRRKI